MICSERLQSFGFFFRVLFVYLCCLVCAPGNELNEDYRWMLIHTSGFHKAESIQFADNGTRIRLSAVSKKPVDVDIRNAVALMQRQPDAFFTPGAEKKKCFFLELAGGDRVLVRNPVFDGTTLAFHHTVWGRISVDLKYLKRLYRAGASSLAEPDFTGLILMNGDQTQGVISSLSNDSIMVEMEGLGKIPVGGLDRVNEVVFNKEIKSKEEHRKANVRISLISGEQIYGKPVSGDKGRWFIQPTWRSKSIPLFLSFIRAVTFTGGKVFLSDLPHRVQMKKPFAGEFFPMRKDRSLFGNILRVSQLTADKGISLHSSTRVDYNLGALKRKPVRFCGMAGIDSEAFFPGASAQIRILLDNKPVQTANLKAGGKAIPLFITIPDGTGVLSIETGFGTLGSVSDNVDILWGSLIYGSE